MWMTGVERGRDPESGGVEVALREWDPSMREGGVGYTDGSRMGEVAAAATAEGGARR